jgi:nucleoside triphosphatase
MKQPSPQPIHQRLIVVPIIYDQQGHVLICKKASDRGVFPGKWGLPGGGMEPGEFMEEALRREVREELGIEIEDIQPLFFKEGVESKYRPGAKSESIHMVYLLFRCRATSRELILNREFVDFAWVLPSELRGFDLDPETTRTFAELKII